MKFKITLISFFILLIFFISIVDNQAQEKKIVFQNHYYYVVHPDGKRIDITSSRTGGEPRVEVIFSPDSEYVAYTTGNCLGFEGSGRDICYLKTDGIDRRIIYSSQFPIRDLYWVDFDFNQYIIFVLDFRPMDVKGQIWVYDFGNKKMVFDTLGLRLERLGDSMKFLVSPDYISREEDKYMLDFWEISFRSYKPYVSSKIFISKDSTKIFFEEKKGPIIYGGIGDLLPECWPGGSYSYMVDVGTDIFWYFTDASLSPNLKFIAFSMKGKQSSFNGLFEIETNKVYPLRFFLSKLTGNHYWSPNSKYVAYVDYPTKTGKAIDVFSIDSTLNFKNPLIVRTSFNRGEFLNIAYSEGSDTLYYTTQFFQSGREYVTNRNIYLGDK